MKTCCNLDWLELSCEETNPTTAKVINNGGYAVKVRDFGTRVFSEMFFVLNSDGNEMFEIRRNPYSKISQGGVIKDNLCHIRVTNWKLYDVRLFEDLRNFILKFGYTVKSIYRCDICLDIQEFKSGMKPETFIKKYMHWEIGKMNQPKCTVHWIDGAENRNVNSLKWGSETSMITTKMYNKSMELRQVKDKPYITEQWERCGYDKTKDVYRIEISISSDARHLVHLDTGLIKTLSLETIDNRDKIYYTFLDYCSHYFDFYYRDENKRKSRCKHLALFKGYNIGDNCKVVRITNTKIITRTDRIIIKRLSDLCQRENMTLQNKKDIVATIKILIKDVNYENWIAQQPKYIKNIVKIIKTYKDYGELFDSKIFKLIDWEHEGK